MLGAALALPAAPLRAQSPEEHLDRARELLLPGSTMLAYQPVVATQRLEALRLVRFAGPDLRSAAAQVLRAVIETTVPPAALRVRIKAAEVLLAIQPGPDAVAAVAGVALRAAAPGGETLARFLTDVLGGVRDPASVAWLVRHLDDTRDPMVALAAAALAQVPEPELLLPVLPSVSRLVDIAASAELPLRAKVVGLLARLPDLAALAAAYAAAQADDGLLRLAAARGLREQAHAPGADAVLGALLEDPLPRVREAAAAAFASAGEDAPLQRLVARMGGEPRRIRWTYAETLRALTGQDLGLDAESWRAWIGSSGTEPTSRVGGARDDYAPRYYDIPIRSDRMVFVIDISGSMSNPVQASEVRPREARSALQAAQLELITTLRALGPDTSFAIVAFASGVRIFDRKGLVRATPSAVSSAVDFVRRLEADGGTETMLALETVFDRFADADTVLLLSDGNPTGYAALGHEGMVSHVLDLNELRGVVIHTIAVVPPGAPAGSSADEGARFMRLLARMTGGATRQVP